MGEDTSPLHLGDGVVIQQWSTNLQSPFAKRPQQWVEISRCLAGACGKASTNLCELARSWLLCY